MEAMTGRTIAIDASMSLYQFLVAVRQGDTHANLSNSAGEVTSHIQGFLSRTVRLLELGIKPVFVFDGKPPDMKRETLASRAERKDDADADLAAALEGGDSEEIRKAAHRTVRATAQMNADVQALLRLLGCPVVLAPSEAEASCAALCKAGLVYACATEDMDALTFGTPVMLKNLFDTESSRTGTKRPVWEIRAQTMLAQLDVTSDAFVDFCILCGCDYTGTVRGVGPATAFKLIKSHGSIEGAVASLEPSKLPPPDEWRYAEARALFRSPEVVDPASVSLSWATPDYAGLHEFLVTMHSFNEVRVGKVVERLKASRTAGQQTRLDSFFRVGAAKAVPADAKFDPFKKRAAGGAGTSGAGKRAAGGGTGTAKGAPGKRPRH
jgi:flap endonuclease-1